MQPDSRFGSVYFTMIRRSGSDVPEWAPEVKTVEYHFPGSNLAEVQIIGQSRMKLNTTVLLETQAEFASFMALLGTVATLRMPYGGTAFPGDEEGQYVNQMYKAFENVLLEMPRPRIKARRDGKVEMDVQFSRQAAP